MCVGAWIRNTTGMQRMPGAPQSPSSTCKHSIFRIFCRSVDHRADTMSIVLGMFF